MKPDGGPPKAIFIVLQKVPNPHLGGENLLVSGIFKVRLSSKNRCPELNCADFELLRRSLVDAFVYREQIKAKSSQCSCLLLLYLSLA